MSGPARISTHLESIARCRTFFHNRCVKEDPVCRAAVNRTLTPWSVNQMFGWSERPWESVPASSAGAARGRRGHRAGGRRRPQPCAGRDQLHVERHSRHDDGQLASRTRPTRGSTGSPARFPRPDPMRRDSNRVRWGGRNRSCTHHGPAGVVTCSLRARSRGPARTVSAASSCRRPGAPRSPCTSRHSSCCRRRLR